MRQGLAALQATGVELLRPYSFALLAGVYGERGQIEEGLNALAEALAVVDKTGERYYEAELYRLKGELLLIQADQVRD
jgi:predicted ATPase